MKIALSLMVTILVIIALIIKPLRKYKWTIMAIYGFAVIVLFVFYNYRTRDLILPFYKPVNQMFYQDDYIKTKEYPDAFMPYLLKGKEVVVPTLVTWDEDKKETYDHWQSGGMLYMNMVNIFEENGAMVSWKEYNFFLDQEKYEDEIIELGYLNDTFRYSFFYNDIECEYGNGFYYYWAYGANSIPFELLICKRDIETADKLYLMFNSTGDMLYLVSESVYEECTGGMD